MGCTGMAWHTLSPAQQADYEKKNPFQVPARTSTSAPLARPRERSASGGALRLGCSAPASGGPVPDSPAPRRTPSPAALLHPPGPASPIRLGPSPLGSRRPQLAQSQGRGAATGSKPATPGAEAPNPSQISTQILGESFFPPFSSQFFPKSLTLTFLYMYYAFWLL